MSDTVDLSAYVNKSVTVSGEVMAGDPYNGRMNVERIEPSEPEPAGVSAD